MSAKYGLVGENQIIEPYEESLAQKTNDEKTFWAKRVAKELLNRFDPDQTRFIILAGRDYYDKLLPYLPNYALPLYGMRMGDRIATLSQWNAQENLIEKTETKIATDTELCIKLHDLFNNMPRYSYNMINQIPWDNGIYVMFEVGEKYNGFDRIVRIGTHTSNGRLKQRLRDHFLKENKEGSIFRKNIGKAILNKNDHPYLEVWSSNSRDKNAMRKKYGNQFDEEFQARIENQVSRYMQTNITFTCFSVLDSDKRLRYEEGIIATLNEAEDFHPSKNWRGNFSPVREIRESGLWLVQGLEGKGLSQAEFEAVLVSIDQSKSRKTNEEGFSLSRLVKPANYQHTIKQSGVREVIAHLKSKLTEAYDEGHRSISIRSGQIHAEMKLKNRMPTVCSAMYKLKKSGDLIVEQPPKGYGSRLVIEYQIPR